MIQDERTYAYSLIERIVEKYPKRMATSDQEKGAQDLMLTEMKKLGLEGRYESFKFNRSLYANLMLHGLVGVLGSAAAFWNPWAGLALHFLAWLSYFADNTRKFYLLRRLFPWRSSQNLLFVSPATQPVRLRLVMLAHIDAAFTGLLFQPKMVKKAAQKAPPGLGWTKFSIGLALWSLVPLMLLDILALAAGWSSVFVLILFSIPAFLLFALNLQVVWKNEIVPGANDNLTGVASLPILASRLSDWQPEDVEIIYVVTGAEEASLGGAHALYRKHNHSWSRSNTFVLTLDTLSGGQLFYLKEGDIWPCPMPSWVPDLIERAKSTNKNFSDVRAFRVPVGGTDAIPFAYGGYDHLALSCIDTEYGAPRHYHLPSDTPENLDMDELQRSFDFAEQVIYQLNERYTLNEQ